MTYNPPYDLAPLDDDDAGAQEARHRAEFFKTLDPFDNIPPALLSSEHISDYARVTGLLHPFYPDDGRLKPASYEARPKRFIRWDNEGRKIINEVSGEQSYVLPENSITFMQIDSKIRLPDYIALRFNLRIKHVHRGVLLGTGPLVDPGFAGELLIPLHNLTATPYEIKANEGIIWIEFTKTTHSPKWPSVRGHFRTIESHKTDVKFERYFELANKNNPIQSSIPSAIKETRDEARKAAVSASRAVRTNRVFASIGILALAGLLIGAISLGVSVVRESASAGSDARAALRQSEAMKSEIDHSKEQIMELRAQIEALRNKSTSAQPSPGTGAPLPHN
jgi:deoxycytidine triphosphate deaminase